MSTFLIALLKVLQKTKCFLIDKNWFFIISSKSSGIDNNKIITVEILTRDGASKATSSGSLITFSCPYQIILFTVFSRVMYLFLQTLNPMAAA